MKTQFAVTPCSCSGSLTQEQECDTRGALSLQHSLADFRVALGGQVMDEDFVLTHHHKQPGAKGMGVTFRAQRCVLHHSPAAWENEHGNGSVSGEDVPC